jgi:hypothetical protein
MVVSRALLHIGATRFRPVRAKRMDADDADPDNDPEAEALTPGGRLPRLRTRVLRPRSPPPPDAAFARKGGSGRGAMMPGPEARHHHRLGRAEKSYSADPLRTGGATVAPVPPVVDQPV